MDSFWAWGSKKWNLGDAGRLTDWVRNRVKRRLKEGLIECEGWRSRTEDCTEGTLAKEEWLDDPGVPVKYICEVGWNAFCLIYRMSSNCGTWALFLGWWREKPNQVPEPLGNARGWSDDSGRRAGGRCEGRKCYNLRAYDSKSSLKMPSLGNPNHGLAVSFNFCCFWEQDSLCTSVRTAFLSDSVFSIKLSIIT